MSYTIVYDKVFIKTPTGYTLAVLHGDNNLWETDKKRARHWNCWLLNKTEEEVMDHFNSWHESKEIFQHHGKWYDNEMLLRWVKNGIKNAMPIEDIIKFSKCFWLTCRLEIWDNSIPYGEPDHRKTELYTNVKTTEEFVEWIAKAEKRITTKTPSEEIYIITDFAIDSLRLKRTSDLPGKVIAKYKKFYVSEVKDGSWKQASSDIKDAIIFDSIEEARTAITNVYEITFIDAEKALKRNENKNYCISVSKRGFHMGYISRVTKSNFHYAYNKNSAAKYTKSEAESQIKKMQSRFVNCEFEIVKAESVKED